MPQQFYLTADPASFTPTTWKGLWDHTASAITQRLDSTKTTADSTKYTIQSNTVPETFANLAKVAVLRYVSGPLRTQTISGTMQLRIGAMASDANANMYFAIHMWATIGDTDIIRCTLIDNFQEGPSLGNPYPIEEKGRDLIYSAAITAGNILSGDRIVIELGYVARNESTSAYYGSLYYGTDYYSNGSPDMVRDP